MTEVPAPIRYEFAWTPELYGEIAARRPPAALGLTGSPRAMAGAVAAALAVVMVLAALPALAGIYGSGHLIAALWGAASALIAVLVVVLPFMRRARITADLATRARQGRVRVTLSAEGVRTETDLSDSRTSWPGVALVAETPRAIMLWLGAAFALPLPDAALPEGIDRAGALARVRRWREAAA